MACYFGTMHASQMYIDIPVQGCVVLCCVVLCCAAGTEVFVRSGVLEGARAVSGVGFELGVACCVWSMEWWRLGK
jgi:hypothetical protein